MSWTNYISIPLVVALAIPQILGGISGASTAKSILTWYKPDVKKPSWHPPLPLFGSIWPVLYTLIGFASFVVYVEGGSFSRNAGPLTLYAAQLLLNVIWQPLFFNARNLQLAQLDNLGTLALAVVTGWSFYKVKPIAGWLFVPYVAFLIFANKLNAAIIALNPSIAGGRASTKAQPSAMYKSGASTGSHRWTLSRMAVTRVATTIPALKIGRARLSTPAMPVKTPSYRRALALSLPSSQNLRDRSLVGVMDVGDKRMGLLIVLGCLGPRFLYLKSVLSAVRTWQGEYRTVLLKAVL